MVGIYPDIETIQAILLKESYISAEDNKAALSESHDSTEYINYLLREELLSKELLGQALAEAHGVPYIDLARLSVPTDNIKLIPEDVARKNRVIAVKETPYYIGITSDAPQSVDSKQLTAIFKKKQIRLGYSLPEQIDTALTAYEQPLETRFQTIIEQSNRVAPEIVDEIIRDALRFNASDIHFEPGNDVATIRFRVDGNLRTAGTIPSNYYDNILNRIKVESGMRIDEHLSAQDGSMRRNTDKYDVNLRVSLIPTVSGEKVVMRVLGSYVQGFGLADIGLDETYRDMLEEYANKPFGMILTTGPTGSGKTTTLYSILKLLNRPNVNITTIEDPVEYKMAGVNQIQVQDETNMTFARGLRAIVRQDPDVILVGEIRDNETAEISVNAALTGHLLLSTFHANNAATAIPRLIDLGIEPFLLASTLQVVVAQRLVRRLCSNCRYSVPLAAVIAGAGSAQEAVAKHFKPHDNVYAGKGCNICGGSGYRGRIGLYEFLEMSDEMKDLVLESPSAPAIEALARKQGARSMFEDGIQKIKNGETTISELIRTVEPPKVKHEKRKA